MISFPNCKINIGLNIIQKRPDGYHDIETIFLPVPLSDILEVIPASDNSNPFNLEVTGIAVDCAPEKNLCVRSYQLLQKEYNLPPADIHLHKVIPSGAGLGGGSSDAAFMLKMLSKLFNLCLSEDELCNLASTLGSDCAFFIKNRALFGYGRGNLFHETTGLTYPVKIVIIHPGINVSTAEAYASITPRRPETGIEELIQQDISKWKDTLKNDFEEPVFQKYPQIRKIKEMLYEHGAVYASMSGSGSAVYGLFTENMPPSAEMFPGMFYYSSSIISVPLGRQSPTAT